MNKINYPYRVRMPDYLGKAIRDTRKSQHMTQKVLADLTGTSVKFISDVERGKNTARIDKVFDLLRALGLTVYIAQNPLPENKGDIR
jgi:HTH-type transcriptional regulator / antitoxin HipB